MSVNSDPFRIIGIFWVINIIVSICLIFLAFNQNPNACLIEVGTLFTLILFQIIPIILLLIILPCNLIGKILNTLGYLIIAVFLSLIITIFVPNILVDIGILDYYPKNCSI